MPPTAAIATDHLRDHVRLACLPGVGSRARRDLLAHFGSPEAVLAASPAALASVPGVGRRLAKAIPGQADTTAADAVLDLCLERDVGILLEGSAGYPPLLARISDAPGLLFVRGSIQPCDSLAIAIVGSRHATAYGRRIAWQLAGGLARAGYTIVSGLARGIDAAAHRGALDAGGRTLAVLGSGVLNIYPPEHADLADEIVARGAVLAEVPPQAAPQAGCFPQRNRIVSGLSLGVIVVEAAERSGALITARLAGEQGREVFAVPGPIDARLSRGCHGLIRDGAHLTETAQDVLFALPADGARLRGRLGLSETQQAAQAAPGGGAGLPAGEHAAAIDAVLALLGPAPTAVDDLIRRCQFSGPAVLSVLLDLELAGRIETLPGNRVALLGG